MIRISLNFLLLLLCGFIGIMIFYNHDADKYSSAIKVFDCKLTNKVDCPGISVKDK